MTTYESEVTSIYDKMPFGQYRGYPLTFIYQFDIGFLKWCIEKKELICIKEWDFIKELSTFQEKMYIPEKSDVKNNYQNVAEFFSDEEILRFLGGRPLETNDYEVNDANSEKLKKFGITPTPPKLFDRTYLSYHWSSFPRLSGTWEFEKFDKTSKGWIIVNLKKTSESRSSIELLNDQLGLIVNLGPLALFKDKVATTIFSADFFQQGELVTIESNLTTKLAGEQYLICKR
ncbi:MAG: hypothetical protein C0433_05875 [Cyclobacterium sp.]|nr:hypothetical protein [Cyclobacterium sp.]